MTAFPAGAARIEVKFLIDANGILQVGAKDLRNGEQHSIEVQPSYGINDSEIERMLEESIEFADMVDNRYIAGIALQVSCWKRRSSDRDEIARECSRVIAHWYRVANWANLASSLHLCVLLMQGHDDRLVARLGVVVRPLTERPLVVPLAGGHVALDDDLARALLSAAQERRPGPRELPGPLSAAGSCRLSAVGLATLSFAVASGR